MGFCVYRRSYLIWPPVIVGGRIATTSCNYSSALDEEASPEGKQTTFRLTILYLKTRMSATQLLAVAAARRKRNALVSHAPLVFSP